MKARVLISMSVTTETGSPVNPTTQEPHAFLKQLVLIQSDPLIVVMMDTPQIQQLDVKT